MGELRIRLPDDFHVHLRQGPAMASYVARSVGLFGRFLAMPNIVPPLVTGRAVSDYLAALSKAVPASSGATQAASGGAHGGGSIRPLVSFKLIPGMGRKAVLDCIAAGALAGKYYPAGSTTNAADGVPDPGDVRAELDAMEEADTVLSIHAEDPSASVMEREQCFLPQIDRILARHPRLRIVVEHLSSTAGVDAVLAWPDRVAATITAHHLAFTIDDLAGERLDPGFYCKPLVKTAADRASLVQAACSGHPRFFFGSDSAPHSAAAKAAGAAGVYASPVALQILAEVFDDAGALDQLEAFTSVRGAAFYRLAPNDGQLSLRREAWTVPELLDGCMPLAHGRTLAWTATRIQSATQMLEATPHRC
ncbi:MAG: dihydroorotase [Spirochaetota bacterium]